MQGNEKVIEQLNARLADELTAINQYMVHAEMCDNWGYEHLHEEIQKRAIDEMKHAEKLITRILFLEGMPVVSVLNKINIGPDVEKMHKNDWKAEETAIKGYNAEHRGWRAEIGDNGTREFLESTLREEEGHIDWIEAQLEPDRANGHPELPRRADRLTGMDRPAVAKLVCSVPVSAHMEETPTTSLRTETSRVTARRDADSCPPSPFQGRIDPVQLPPGDGLFDPGDEAAAVIVLAGIAQLVERQRSGRADDVPERVALDRVDIAACMLPKRFHKAPQKV